MAQVIKIKRSTTTASPTTLTNGELAYSAVTGGNHKLFIGRPGGGTGDIDAIGGKYFTDIIDAAASSNTVGTLVLRDASGNFSANTITATSFVGAFDGTLGATTPASVAATTISTTDGITIGDTATLTYSAGTDSFIFNKNITVQGLIQGNSSLDGGSAASIYLTVQSLNGGNA